MLTAPSELYPATGGDEECRRCWGHLRRGGSLGWIPLLEELSFNLSTVWPCVNQQGEHKKGTVTLSFSVWELIEGTYWLNPINEGTTSGATNKTARLQEILANLQFLSLDSPSDLPHNPTCSRPGACSGSREHLVKDYHQRQVALLSSDCSTSPALTKALIGIGSEQSCLLFYY